MPQTRACSAPAASDESIARDVTLPLVSIGVPVRNGSTGIDKALASLTHQTYTKLEIIVSDNASDDDTVAIVARSAAADPRIRLVRQHKNIGMLGNFRAVLDEAKGEYFLWAAHDDTRESDYVEQLLSRLVETPDAILAMGRTISVEGDHNAVVEADPSTMGMNLRERMRTTGHRRPYAFYGLWRTALLRRIPMREAFWSADTPIILAAAAIGPFLYVPEAGFTYTNTPKHFFRKPVAALCSVPIVVLNSYRASAAVAGPFAGMLGAWHMAGVLWRQTRMFIARRIGVRRPMTQPPAP